MREEGKLDVSSSGDEYAIDTICPAHGLVIYLALPSSFGGCEERTLCVHRYLTHSQKLDCEVLGTRGTSHMSHVHACFGTAQQQQFLTTHLHDIKRHLRLQCVWTKNTLQCTPVHRVCRLWFFTAAVWLVSALRVCRWFILNKPLSQQQNQKKLRGSKLLFLYGLTVHYTALFCCARGCVPGSCSP